MIQTIMKRSVGVDKKKDTRYFNQMTNVFRLAPPIAPAASSSYTAKHDYIPRLTMCFSPCSSLLSFKSCIFMYYLLNIYCYSFGEHHIRQLFESICPSMKGQKSNQSIFFFCNKYTP
eukprot:Tbor_TRINITY_DN5240_c1_g7::TRINITY_DN5240_c1_g7_i1::g.16737::m.16737